MRAAVVGGICLLMVGCSSDDEPKGDRLPSGATGGMVTGGGPALGTGGAGAVGTGGVGIAGGGTGGAPLASGGTPTTGGVATGGDSTGATSSGGDVGTGGTNAGGNESTGGETGTGGAGEPTCPTELVGFASLDADGVDRTTGGGNATPTTVTTLAELRAAAQDSAPRVVVVSGTIATMDDGDGYPLKIASNKTIRGADENATIHGGLTVSGESNVIIQNLNIHGVWPNPGPGDTLSTNNAHHVWFDHLNVWDAEDGLLDITNQSSYQTVSWCKFWYTDSSNGHRLASLNGSGGGDHPEDYGRLKVTYHHNWWSDLVDQRMPRVMYGQGHEYNNYFNAPGNTYCIGVGSYGSVLIENNFFENVKSPHLFMYDVYMYAEARGNEYINTTGSRDEGQGGSRDVAGQESFEPGPFDPPYDYTLDPAGDVPELVKRCAGPR